MPENQAVEGQEWSQESVEKQAAEVEKQDPPKVETDEEQTREKVETVVPLPALQEERAKRREATQRAQDFERQLAEQARFNQQLLARIAQGQQPQAPDPGTDPLGAVVHTSQQTQAELARMRQEQAQRDAWQAQQAQQAQWQQAVQVHEASFRQQTPDYDEAVKFAQAARMKEYQAMGLSRDAAAQRLTQDKYELINWAFQSGESPAKAAYDWAAARGYVPAQKRLEMQREGQGASTPTGGGGKSGGAPSLEALLKMDSKDFAKATAGDNWEKLLKKYM